MILKMDFKSKDIDVINLIGSKFHYKAIPGDI